MLHISRRGFLSSSIGSAAFLMARSVSYALTNDPIRIGYTIPNNEQIERPSRLDWTAPANLVGMVLEPLVRIGGENEIDYVLAEHIDCDASGRIWRINIRSEAHWRGGEPITSAQVAANLNYWIEDEKSPLGDQLRQFVEKIEVEDVRLLKVSLKKADYQFLYLLTSYAALIMHPRDKWQFTKQSTGTGPFAMEHYSPQDEARFLPIADYWDSAKRAHYPVTFVHDTNALDGNFDFIPQLNPDRGPALKSQGISIKQNLLADALVFHMDCRQGPLTNPRFRQALRACLDPQRLVESLYGYGRAADHTHASSIHRDYPDDWVPTTVYDPDKARQLLEGQKLSLPLHYIADNMWQKNAVDAYVVQAQRVGVSIIPIPHEQVEFDKNWDKYTGLTSLKWIHRPLAMQLYRSVYYSKAKWNLSGWKNEEFDREVDLFNSTPLDDQAKVKGITKRAMKILQEDGPMIQAAWLDCNKAYNPKRLNVASVIVGSGGHIYANLLERA